MNRKLVNFIFILLLASAVALPAQAISKYKKYMEQSLGDLLLMCIEGDDNGCFFYAGMQAKQGNLKEAHDAYLIGAQNAKNRSGYRAGFSAGISLLRSPQPSHVTAGPANRRKESTAAVGRAHVAAADHVG